MTCQQCGSQAHGDLCVDCRIDQAAQAADLDRGDDYECPDCGGETSGKDVVCYRCRDSHQDGDGDDSDDGEDDAADAGDGEEAVLVTDGGVDVDTAGETEVSGEPFDERAAKALTEYMVVLEDLPEVRDDSERFVVVSQSGSTYTVDLRSESCECPDSLHRGVECKHRRRVAFATGRAVIPAWADLDRVHDRLGEHVSGAPRVETPHGTRTLEEVRD